MVKSDWFSIIAICISIGALIVSYFSATYYRRQAISQEQATAIALRQWEIQSAARQREEEASREEASASRRANLRAEAVRAGSGHRLRVSNMGPAVARDVRIAFDRALDDMRTPPELEEYLMAGALAPTDSREYGIVTPGTSRHYTVIVSWADTESTKTTSVEIIVPTQGQP